MEIQIRQIIGGFLSPLFPRKTYSPTAFYVASRLDERITHTLIVIQFILFLTSLVFQWIVEQSLMGRLAVNGGLSHLLEIVIVSYGHLGHRTLCILSIIDTNKLCPRIRQVDGEAARMCKSQDGPKMAIFHTSGRLVSIFRTVALTA